MNEEFGPDIAVKEELFQSYVRPFLIDNPHHSTLSFWFEQAYVGWLLGFSKKDAPLIQLIHKMCITLKNEQGDKFLEIAAGILSSQHETNYRSHQARTSLRDSEINDGEKYSSEQKFYKVLFENEFRLWATIPFFYLTKDNAVIVDHVAVGGSEKYHAIKLSKKTFISADLQELILGFDNQIRNAGEGHDTWEVDDDGNLILKITDPKSGKLKREMKLKPDELTKLIETARKTLWILETGFLTFYENERDFFAKLSIKKVLKLKEIEDSVRAFARERMLSLEAFTYDKEKKILAIKVKYTPQKYLGTQRQLLTAHASYDIIDKKCLTRYEYHMLDVVRMSLLKLGREQEIIVQVDMQDEDGKSLAILEYDPAELKKMFSNGEVGVPVPKKGKVPENMIEIVAPIKVPYGTRSIFEELILGDSSNQGKAA